MRLLLDTHIVIWLMLEPSRVPATLRTLMEEASLRYISTVTAVEIALKQRKLGTRFEFSLDHLMLAYTELVCEELPLLIRHTHAIARIPLLHKDPHDHALMAQAICDGLILITLDENIHRYRVPGLQLAS